MLSTTIEETLRRFKDHAAFARESLSIRDKRGAVVPLELQPAQIKLNKIIERCREKRKPVRIIVLKARQVMVSTGVAAQFFQVVGFSPGQKALVVAHEDKASKNIFGYYQQLNDFYRKFGGVVSLPPIDNNAPAAGKLEYEGGSYVLVATANNLKTGRSFSLRCLHLSEYAFWKDAKTLMMGLMQSVPDDPDTMVVIESTANGVGGDFWQRWQDANDPSSGSEWTPMFFAWCEHPEYVRPVADKPSFEASLTREELELVELYGLTLEQLHWRRWKVKNDCGGSLETFKQEYPINPEEAFLFSGRPRFSLAHLARMPIKHDGLVGELYEDTHERKTRLVFQASEERHGALTVYKKPNQNKRYVAGIDVAEGITITKSGEDPDYSVAIFLDADTGEQVAKLRGRIEPGPFAEYLAGVAQWFNWAFLVPEANGPGIALIGELLKQGYPPGLIYHRKPSPDQQFIDGHGTLLQELGWKQGVVTRPQLISRMDMAIREMAVIIVDPNTAAECRAFVIKPNGRVEAQDGTHDDEVIALGLAIIGLEHMPADKRLQGIRQQRAGDPITAGTVRRYGKGRQDSRGDLIRL